MKSHPLEPLPSGFKKYRIIFGTILRSGQSAAYYAVWNKFLQIIYFLNDRCWSALESGKRRKYANTGSPPIMVVGIHRTGSTFVSQVLADALPYVPIGNVNAIFSRSCYYAHKFLNIFRSGRKSNIMKNYYGISKGFFAIGDCYEYWDQWFGPIHYFRPKQLPYEKMDALRANFACLEKAYGQPIICKNNRNSLLIDYFHQCFPDATFVMVERDAADVVRSTIRASEDFFNGKSLWGLMRNDYDHLDYSNLMEAASDQYIKVDQMMRKQLAEVPKERIVMVQYEDFCADPLSAVQRVARKSGMKESAIQKISLSSKAFRKTRKTSEAERAEIMSTLERYQKS